MGWGWGCGVGGFGNCFNGSDICIFGFVGGVCDVWGGGLVVGFLIFGIVLSRVVFKEKCGLREV